MEKELKRWILSHPNYPDLAKLTCPVCTESIGEDEPIDWTRLHKCPFCGEVLGKPEEKE